MLFAGLLMIRVSRIWSTLEWTGALVSLMVRCSPLLWEKDTYCIMFILCRWRKTPITITWTLLKLMGLFSPRCLDRLRMSCSYLSYQGRLFTRLQLQLSSLSFCNFSLLHLFLYRLYLKGRISIPGLPSPRIVSQSYRVDVKIPAYENEREE